MPHITRVRRGQVSGALCVRLPLGALAALLLASSPASARPPLSPSEYEARAICAQPAPGYSGCLSLRLIAD
ncbi:MAG TPA: hypothetical protein VNZ44_03705, partial [Pyrinomonadaceae bacterium]|nr:hypothetical protein [Pyrinomonadaceae bacterium]